MVLLYLTKSVQRPQSIVASFFATQIWLKASHQVQLPRQHGRAFASASASNEAVGAQDRQPFRVMATWIASDPTSIVGLSFSAGKPSSLKYPDHQWIRRAVFFVTPPLAHLIEADSSFLRSALSRLYDNFPTEASTQDPITSVVAAVDKLPGAFFPLGKTSGTDLESGQSEGLAFLLTSLPQQPMITYASDAESTGECEATVRFVSKRDTEKLDDGGVCKLVTHVTLPVANTLFVNGRKTTLFEDTWSRVPAADAEAGTGGMAHGSRRSLKQFRIFISKKGHAAFPAAVPLHALTGPRKISNVMGNIIREVEVEEKKTPASYELEIAVGNFRKEVMKNTDSEGKLQVFALVSRDSLVNIKSKPSTHRGPDRYGARTPDAVITQIWAGARLFRVTGGGGGWGNKQGLLALDPATDFENSHVTSSMSQFGGETSDVAFRGEDSSLIAVGSNVQFLAIHMPKVPQQKEMAVSAIDERPDLWRSKAIAFYGKQTVVAGIIPTQEFAAAPPRVGDSESTKSASWIFLPNHFGMLSEGGAALGIDKSEIYQAAGTEGLSAERPLYPWSRSRFDVPQTLFVSTFSLNNAKVREKKKQQAQAKASEVGIKENRTEVPRKRKPKSRQEVTFHAEVPQQGRILDLGTGSVSDVASNERLTPPTAAAAELSSSNRRSKKVNTQAETPDTKQGAHEQKLGQRKPEPHVRKAKRRLLFRKHMSGSLKIIKYETDFTKMNTSDFQASRQRRRSPA